MDWQRLFYRQETDNVISGLTTTATTDLPAAGTGSPLSTNVPDQGENPGGSGSNGGGSEPARGPGSRAITFEPWDDIESRIFKIRTSQSPSISWKRSNAIQIEDISWHATISSGNGGYEEIATAEERQDALLVYDDDADQVELGLTRFRLDRRLEDYHANNMVIRIVWQDESTSERGSTTSGVFTVVGGEEDDEQLELFRRQFQQASGDDLTELNDGSETKFTGARESTDPTGNGLRPGVSSTSTTLLSSSASSTTMPTAISSNESDSSDSGGGGGGGLSTGAIAGIAVAGAVVFLALVGGLVFWMLRRRRRNKDRGHYNQPTNSTTFMGGDKDIHQVTESPHSTYSNDQHVPLSNLAGAGTSRDIGGPSGHHDLHDDDADYAPYRDDDRGAQGSAAGQRSDGAGTPHGVSRSVAHLVEDGMTEDEIRRLEEEERQLDDAIQRHGRSR